MFYKEEYSNNILSGERKECYSNGRVKSIVNYENGKPNGNYVEYYDKEYSKVKSAGAYLDGKREGQWHWYYDTGELKRIIAYDKGSVPLDEDSLQYISKEYYKNGKQKPPVKFDTSIALNEKNKRLIEFREEVFNHDVYYSTKTDIYSENKYNEHWNISGKLTEYGGKLNNNKMNGNNIVFFFQTDKIKQETYYKNGKEDGDSKMYWDNGNLMNHYLYKNGELHGEFKTFYQDGKLEITGCYTHDLKDGIWNQYDKNSNLKKQIKFEKGKFISEKERSPRTRSRTGYFSSER